jgi:hypothetical protein
MKKIYLPQDTGELFSICSSREGFVVPLVNFGYPDLHITFYIKDVEGKLENYKLNIHITNEKSKEFIFGKELVFNKEELEKNLGKKLEEVKKLTEEYYNRLKYKKISKEGLVCIDCFIEDNIKPNIKIENREDATKTYALMQKDWLIRYNQYPLCDKRNHKRIYDPFSKKEYYKFLGFITPWEDIENYSKDFQKIFVKEMIKISEIMEEWTNEFKKKLKEIKTI